MFHPVGPQSPSIYWRRRLVLLATLVVVIMLIALTARAAMSGADGTKPNAAGSTGQSHRPSAPASSSSSRHAPHNRTSSRSSHRLVSPDLSSSRSSQSGKRHRHHRHQPGTPTTSTSTSAPPPQCSMNDLEVQAAVAQTRYHVGDKPVVMVQVTNTGTSPCVEDLSDKQIVLKVYNGESRVWGSHDCQVMPGTDDRVLPPGQPVRVSVTWSGLTSKPGCTGRQQVGAGSYTLYAWLAGHEGKAASFAIS